MISRKRLTRGLALILAALVISGIGVLVRQAFWRPTTITADLATATGIYPGDDVRVVGIRVGSARAAIPRAVTAGRRFSSSESST